MTNRSGASHDGAPERSAWSSWPREDPFRENIVWRGGGRAHHCFVARRSPLADGSGDPTAVKNEDGKYFDKEGNPTYKIQADGTVDWYTYSAFAATIPTAMCATGPMAWARPMRRR